jgi:parallel beta-helix repeat protein
VTEAIATITVEENPVLDSEGDNAVRFAYCGSGDSCAMDTNQINASVSGNGPITSAGDGIQTRFHADPDEPGSVGSSIELQVADNDSITAESDALDIEALLCCDSNNRATIAINGNGPISTLPEGSDAIDINASACCSPGSGVNVEVSGNTGDISAAEGEAIGMVLGCCGSNNVEINDNEGTISSLNDNGIRVAACVEDEVQPQDDELECVDASTTVLNIMGNTLTGSNEDGIHICCGAFSRTGERSTIADNVVTMNAEDGIEIDSSSGLDIMNNVVTDNGTIGDGGTNGITIGNIASVVSAAVFDHEILANSITISQNETQRNVGLGIDLVGYSPLAPDPALPTQNDLDYSVVGCLPYPPAPAIAPNECLLYPTLVNVVSDHAIGTACVGCLVEVFLANDIPEDQTALPAGAAHSGGGPPQHGEGAIFLASGTVNVEGGFDIELPCGVPSGDLTATATDEDGNTSEFAANILFNGTSGIDCTPTITVTAVPGTPTVTPQPTTPTTTPTLPAAGTPTPTRTRTATPTTQPGICGDVNGVDGVNSIDAAIILQYSAGLLQTLIEPQNADTNGDGEIDSIDAALILQNVAGLLDELQC